MRLEISRAERDEGVANRVGLIERVFCKVAHLVVEFFGDFPFHAVIYGAYAFCFSVFVLFAVDKVSPLLFHDLGLFLAHGAPYYVGSAVRVARKPSEYLHYLLLINDTAVGYRQYFFEFGNVVLYLFGIFSVFKVLRNAVHRARTEKRDCRRYVFYVFRLHIYKKLFHSRRFELEHAVGLSRRQKFIGLFVAEINLFYVKTGLGLSYFLLRIGYYGKVSYSEQVDFQKSYVRNVVHGVLRYNRVSVYGERHVFVYRLVHDDNARRVHRRVPRHALKLLCVIDHRLYCRRALINFRKLLVFFKRLVYRNTEFHRDVFRNAVNVGVIYVHHPAYVAHRRPCRHCSEGYYFGNAVSAVFFGKIILYLRAPLVAEIDVEVGHANPLGIKESFEKKVVFYRVNVGYSEKICRKTARSRAPARSYGDFF